MGGFLGFVREGQPHCEWDLGPSPGIVTSGKLLNVSAWVSSRIQ